MPRNKYSLIYFTGLETEWTNFCPSLFRLIHEFFSVPTSTPQFWRFPFFLADYISLKIYKPSHSSTLASPSVLGTAPTHMGIFHMSEAPSAVDTFLSVIQTQGNGPMPVMTRDPSAIALTQPCVSNLKTTWQRFYWPLFYLVLTFRSFWSSHSGQVTTVLHNFYKSI